ncbi:MAG: hypothetical protein GF307_14840 [candidate division Zixibacteria bacterium]|nr:hypothetical protein [candidate division Zixibacteria bacterium]
MAMKILTLYLLVVISTDFISLFCPTYAGTNFWIYHLFTLFEYIFLTAAFILMQKGTTAKLIFKISIAVFTTIWIAAKLMFENPGQFDSITLTLASVFLVGISAFTLIDISRRGTGSLIKLPLFWYSVAVLIYFSGNIVVFAISRAGFLWQVHAVINILFLIILGVSFICHRFRSTTYGP